MMQKKLMISEDGGISPSALLLFPDPRPTAVFLVSQNSKAMLSKQLHSSLAFNLPLAPSCRRSRYSPICTTSPSSDLPLRQDSRLSRVSHAAILSHAAQSITEIVTSGQSSLKLTIDFPAERSETRAGTLVSRFENNLNFLERLVQQLGGDSPKKIGGVVDIRDNINPQGGGEYLTDDEVMVGLRTESSSLQRPLLALMNAGVDAATLKGVKELDNDSQAVILLLNCGLDRLSWFTKMSFGKYFDDYQVAYYLKNIGGNGWLLKRGNNPWRVFAELSSGVELIWETNSRPSIVDAEAEVRLALAGIKRDR